MAWYFIWSYDIICRVWRNCPKDCENCKINSANWRTDFPRTFSAQSNMHYVYILKSIPTRKLYIGRTDNLPRRIRKHNSGETFTTKKYKPWVLIYCEGYFDFEDAKEREKVLKQFGKVYAQLKRRIQRSLRSAEKVRGLTP